MVMQEANSTGQAAKPDQKNIEAERKKLDDDFESGKITQAEYFKKVQELTGSPPAPPQPQAPAPQPAPAPATGQPQLPPATNPPQGGVKPVTPITPITPLTPQQAGPQEEIPPIGQALAIGSEDVEVVECYKCGGLITVTTPQRPVIIACPACGTKGEVTAEELAPIEQDTGAAPKATAGVSLDEQKIFKFDGEAERKPKGPSFGSTLDSDLAKQDDVDKSKSVPGAAPGSTPAQKTTTAPPPATTTETPKAQPKTSQPQKKD
jgi:hypothetical protein